MRSMNNPPAFVDGSQMDWLSKRETKATEATGQYTWHQQPGAKVRTAIVLLLLLFILLCRNQDNVLDSDSLCRSGNDTAVELSQ